MTNCSDLPTSLYRADQVRELDRVAIEDLGIPGAVLMERAGLAAYRAMRRQWPRAKRVVILCGIGNNGGDGFVVARNAREAGLEVSVCHVGDPQRLAGDARGAYDAMERVGLCSVEFATGALDGAEVAVDALFGTGLDREVRGPWAEAVAALNDAPVPVLAVDIPSGLHADTGRVLGVAVHADLTVTFIGLKQGLFTGDGPACCGMVLFDDLAVPGAVYDCVEPSARRMDYATVRGVLAARGRTAHKGDFGHVLVIGGDTGFAGAARMAGEAAARVGAGLVSVATRSAHAPAMAMSRPELMCRGTEDPAELEPLATRASVLAVGPGLGQTDWGRAMLESAMRAERPMVLDADGLNLLARGEDVSRRDDWVLTPHPGEAARLLACSPAEIQGDRFAALDTLAKRYGGVWVLKGSGTIAGDATAEPSVATVGNPGMATGGMGDVLTGVIAGLLAQGLPTLDAARLGVCIHGRAADLAAADGERGLLACDLMPHLRPLANPGT